MIVNHPRIIAFVIVMTSAICSPVGLGIRTARDFMSGCLILSISSGGGGSGSSGGGRKRICALWHRIHRVHGGLLSCGRFLKDSPERWGGRGGRIERASEERGNQE
ncbi:hypothetical protein Vadar_033292 [Vaccinium darrowii]|uniref:Uncharacterized protein n=1 Tax=Vaccinium darrowii TaxID=229202 RepID=A0ACB7Z046_9ERIC|nr:hypothetical protein Vadar_033292 [Vaccinium darrowii]